MAKQKKEYVTIDGDKRLIIRVTERYCWVEFYTNHTKAEVIEAMCEAEKYLVENKNAIKDTITFCIEGDWDTNCTEVQYNKAETKAQKTKRLKARKANIEKNREKKRLIEEVEKEQYLELKKKYGDS